MTVQKKYDLFKWSISLSEKNLMLIAHKDTARYKGTTVDNIFFLFISPLRTLAECREFFQTRAGIISFIDQVSGHSVKET